MTSRVIRLTIPGAIPSKANSYRRGRNGTFYAAPEVHVFSATAYVAMQVARVKPIVGPVEVCATLYPANNRGDLTGCEKALLDALQGWRYQIVGRGRTRKRIKVTLPHGCYHDDRQVKRLVLEHGGVDKENPRAEVTVSPWDQKGQR